MRVAVMAIPLVIVLCIDRSRIVRGVVWVWVWVRVWVQDVNAATVDTGGLLTYVYVCELVHVCVLARRRD